MKTLAILAVYSGKSRNKNYDYLIRVTDGKNEGNLFVNKESYLKSICESKGVTITDFLMNAKSIQLQGDFTFVKEGDTFEYEQDGVKKQSEPVQANMYRGSFDIVLSQVASLTISTSARLANELASEMKALLGMSLPVTNSVETETETEEEVTIEVPEAIAEGIETK